MKDFSKFCPKIIRKSLDAMLQACVGETQLYVCGFPYVKYSGCVEMVGREFLFCPVLVSCPQAIPYPVYHASCHF